MSEVQDGVFVQMLDDIAIAIAGKTYRNDITAGHKRAIWEESMNRICQYGDQLIVREATFRSWKGAVDYQTKRREAYDEVINKAIIYGQKQEDKNV